MVPGIISTRMIIICAVQIYVFNTETEGLCFGAIFATQPQARCPPQCYPATSKVSTTMPAPSSLISAKTWNMLGTQTAPPFSRAGGADVVIARGKAV